MNELEVELEGLNYTDDDIAAIPHLEELQRLALLDTAITDHGIRALRDAKSLGEISITSDYISDLSLDTLARLPNLRSLLIQQGPRIGDKGAQSLSNCTQLHELYLCETAVTDRGLALLSQLSEVWSLALDDTRVSDAGCSVFSRMPRLSLLSLNRTQVTGAALKSLADNQHFHLYLEGSPVTANGIKGIAQRLTNLKLISLSHSNAGDEAATILSKLTGLNDIRMSHTRLTDKGLMTFSGHPFLDVIYVKGCDVSKDAVASLKAASPRKLTVYGP